MLSSTSKKFFNGICVILRVFRMVNFALLMTLQYITEKSSMDSKHLPNLQYPFNSVLARQFYYAICGPFENCKGRKFTSSLFAEGQSAAGKAGI